MSLTYHLKCLHLSVTQPEEQQGPTIELKRNLETNIKNLSFVHIKYFWLFALFLVFAFLGEIGLVYMRIFALMRILAIVCIVWFLLLDKRPLKDLEKPMTLKASEKVSDFVCTSKYLVWSIKALIVWIPLILIVLCMYFYITEYSKLHIKYDNLIHKRGLPYYTLLFDSNEIAEKKAQAEKITTEMKKEILTDKEIYNYITTMELTEEQINILIEKPLNKEYIDKLLTEQELTEVQIKVLFNKQTFNNIRNKINILQIFYLVNVLSVSIYCIKCFFQKQPLGLFVKEINNTETDNKKNMI